MAVIDLGKLGEGIGLTAGTTLAVTNTTGAVIPAGTFVHLVGAWDSINTATAPTVTCSTIGGATAVANHATAVGSGASGVAGTGVWHQCFRAVTTASIAIGATIATLTSNQSAVKRAAAARGWSGVTATLRGTVATHANLSGNASAVTAGTALAAGDLVIGSVSHESAALINADTDTLNGSWSTLVGAFTTGGVGAANVGVGIQGKIVTATGAQTYDTTIGATGDSVGCVYSLEPAAAPAPASGSAAGALAWFGYASGPPLRNFFDGGADGVTVTTANSDDGTGKPLAVTLTSIGLTYETDRALLGPSCAKVSDAAGTGGAPNGSTAVLIYGSTPWSVLQAAAEVWVYIPTGSTWNTAGDVLAIRNATGNIAKVQINASRVAFVSDAAGAVSGGSAPTAIPFDTWYRIALWCKVGETTSTGQIQARVGAAFDAPSWTMTPVTNANTGTPSTPITNARGGKLTTTHTPPIFYLGGFNAGPGHSTFIADPVLPKTGSAAGAIAWAGTGSGKRTPKGSSTTGAVAWVGSASGDTPPNRGNAAGAFTFVGAASGSRPVVPPKTGSAVGAISWAGSAGGRKAMRGDAVGAFTFAGAASGKRTPKASTTGAVAFVGAASGAAPAVGVSQGSSSGAITWAGTGTGRKAPKATSSGAFTFTGSAAGSAPIVPPKTGSAAGAIAWAGTAAGRKAARGTAAGSLSWAGAAAGDSPSNRGSSAGAFTLTSSATGGRASRGAADGAITWLVDAAGTRHPAGTAVGGLTFTGNAAGFAPEVGVSQGVSSGHVQWTGTAVGGAGAGGRAAGDVLWAGTAAGARAAYAQALGAIAWLGSGSGARRPLGDVRAAITWAGLAAGFAPQVGVSQGVSSGALSWFGLASGKRKAKGSSMTEINWAAVAAGLRNASATSEGELSWMGVATGARDPEDSLPVPTLVDAMRPIVIALEANGIRCTADYKFLNPPCCYLPPPDLDFRFRQGDFTANYSLVLIAANTTRRLALEEMAQLLVVVQRVLNDRAVHAIPEDVPTNDGSAVLLAYRLTWSERIRRRPAPQVAAAR